MSATIVSGESEPQQKACDKEKPEVAEVATNSTSLRHTQNAAANTFSQPIHDVFVQYNQTFRRTDRKRYEQMIEARKNEGEVVRFESTEAALAVQTFFHNLSLIFQGFLSGLATAHAIFAFVFADVETLSKGYEWIAMPVHATFYVCFVISTVSALDRLEFGGGFMQTVKKLINVQCACLGVLFWTTGLALTLSSTIYDECLSMPSAENCQAQFGVNPPVIWRWLSAIRAATALFGWFLLALSPNANFLREQIQKPIFFDKAHCYSSSSGHLDAFLWRAIVYTSGSFRRYESKCYEGCKPNIRGCYPMSECLGEED